MKFLSYSYSLTAVLYYIITFSPATISTPFQHSHISILPTSSTLYQLEGIITAKI